MNLFYETVVNNYYIDIH